jgi:N-acetylneuraminate synthase
MKKFTEKVSLKSTFYSKSNGNLFDYPYIIAEAGVNHECSIAKAIEMIHLAKRSGVNAIKFQAYKANLICSRKSPAYWDTKKETVLNQYDLFKKFDKFSENDFKILKKECDSVGIDFLCTPFDHQSAKYINKLVKVFKISSSDITNFPLIELIAKFNKPIILSTGASKYLEIKSALNIIKKTNNKKKITLLHCVLNYPTLQKNASLGKLIDLKKNFPNCILGYSDHTTSNNIDNIIYAWLLGARVIEKHFTYNKKLKGNDHYHSADQKDFFYLINKIRNIKISLKNEKKSIFLVEKKARIYARRSIYSARDIKKNSIITTKDIICKRPAYNGLHPKYYNKIIGRKIKKDLKEDQLIKLNYF